MAERRPDAVSLRFGERHPEDPMLHALAAASVDNERSDPEEIASAAAALSAYRRGEGASLDALRFEFGLD